MILADATIDDFLTVFTIFLLAPVVLCAAFASAAFFLFFLERYWYRARNRG